MSEMASSPASVPPTLVVVHRKERRSKCTVLPLRGRPDFQFYRDRLPAVDLTNYVRLGFHGPMLSQDDAACGLLVIDGTWRWAAELERQLESIPVRSLPPLRTAYPRTSKFFDDPDGGLATVEAIYAAYRLLGRSVDGLLEHYVWADQFLQANQESLSVATPAALASRAATHG